MIPKLYSETETEFTGGPICYLKDAIDFEVTEVLNGLYEVEFKYPVFASAFPELQIDRIVCCTHDDEGDEQPFRIYSIDTPIDGLVTFYAHHISYELSYVILKPFEASSALQALENLKSYSINPNPFTFWTDLSRVSEYALSEPNSVRAALFGDKESIIATYNGELEFDKYTVKMYSRRGSYRNVTIRYGKNLVDLEQSIDAEQLYNAVVPYWVGKTQGVDVIVMIKGDNKIVTLPDTQNIVPVARNFSSEFKEMPEEEELIQAAKDFLTANQPWNPVKSIKVDFVQLWQTDDYKDVAALQRVKLGDSVSVYHPDLDITVDEIKVVKVVYDPMTERYLSMELGDEQKTFVQQLNDIVNTQIVQEVTGFEAVLNAEINHITQMITNPGKGHVVFVGTDDEGKTIYGTRLVPNLSEIWWMDTTSTSTASKILRINVEGIGFANSPDGPFKTGWTLDGHFVADFITAGTFNANLIRAGILSDYNGTTWSLTQDTTPDATKVYYTMEGESPNYIYTKVANPVSDNMSTYYEQKVVESHNYWNLETGEFRLSPNTKIGDETVIGYVEDSLSQEGVFNALTNDGAIKTITMDANGKLYINADWISTGHIDAEKIRLFGKMDVFKDKTSFLPANKGGYIGFGKGSTDSHSTNGMIIGHDGTNNGYKTINYLIVTDAGVRMTAISGRTYYQRELYVTGEEAVCDADLRFEKTPFAHDIKDVRNVMADGGMWCNGLWVQSNVSIGGGLSCSGTKNRIVKTDNYSERLLYCYEMPSPIFGDLGSGIIAEDGKAYVYIDPVFAETINTSNYQVFLQAYGSNPVYVLERKPDHFVVSGTSGTEFGWEIKAKQADFDQRRLEEKKLEMEKPEQQDFGCQVTEIDYGEMASEHVKSLRDERIAI